MQTFDRPDAMRIWADERRREGRSIALVPTMGALHRAHMALAEEGARRCDLVVVSIFVNPLQFNEDVDFDSYPRPVDADIAACESAGVDAVYVPTAAAMYPPGAQTRVVPGALGEIMEGPMRPGHFEGVATVVAKLFGAIRPDVALFGQKDYQQLAIIDRMSRDLDLGVEVVGHPTLRAGDGLAISSRNLNLTDSQRAAAVCVPRSLDAAICRAAHRGATTADVVAAATEVVRAEPAARHEYTTVFDAATLVEVDDLATRPRHPGGVRVATAVWFGDTRLIDNRDLFEGS
ncbi:MAG: pantoate--beta-alanine ligase [Acidimicrobiia bacterium]|nr:pantoate--beta-alanine ligase [Acidimicrobiia bacterium]